MELRLKYGCVRWKPSGNGKPRRRGGGGEIDGEPGRPARGRVGAGCGDEGGGLRDRREEGSAPEGGGVCGGEGEWRGG